MKISKDIIEQATAWRRHLHAHPELGFEEHGTSNFIAETLESLGIEVHRGIAITGVVGVLKRGTSERSIGLRADMDALPLVELGDVDYRSKNEGSMHACGHDGHSAMLLGAASYLSQYGDFDGTVYFIFQPAEENLAGGRAMVEDGLFERFQIDQVYGMHNWPGRPLGDICVNDEAMMASFDIFDISLVGRGGHAAIPENARDPIVAAAELVQHLQSIVSRRISAHDSAVLSITQISGGETYNIIPEEVKLKGTVRALSELVRLQVKEQLIKANGVFEYIGLIPQTTYLRSLNILNEFGYVLTDEKIDIPPLLIRLKKRLRCEKLPRLFLVRSVFSKGCCRVWLQRISHLCCVKNRVLISG